jgi:sec-independent protein translocase protein TatB
MFNVSSTELLVVLLLALIVLGPQKLPELARSIGRGMREFRKMQDEVKDMVQIDLNPEPPAVHQQGVSGPKRTTPRPHRTPRPVAGASSEGVAPTSEPAPPGDVVPSEAGSGDDGPARSAEGSASEDDRPDGPPAAAGAG